MNPMLSPEGHVRRPNEEIVLSKFVEFVHSVEGILTIYSSVMQQHLHKALPLTSTFVWHAVDRVKESGAVPVDD